MKTVALLVLMLFASMSPAAPDGVDLHGYWDQRCSGCHGHAGEFARRFLQVEDGKLLGAHHRSDLDLFLRNHYLNDGLLEPVRAMLLAQVTTPPLFLDKCAGCHGNAADFARKSLAIRDGALVGAASGRKLADYLVKHGGLGPTEVPVVVDNLTRVRKEVAAVDR
jgi:hypothetical protein